MNDKTDSVRFWAYLNGGAVEVTLMAGDVFEHVESSETEEGWTARSETFVLRDGVVTRECVDDGVDADGRITQYMTLACPVDRLASGNPDPEQEGVVYPEWETVESRQRDYQAEAAGY